MQHKPTKNVLFLTKHITFQGIITNEINKFILAKCASRDDKDAREDS